MLFRFLSHQSADLFDRQRIAAPDRQQVMPGCDAAFVFCPERISGITSGITPVVFRKRHRTRNRWKEIPIAVQHGVNASTDGIRQQQQPSQMDLRRHLDAATPPRS